MSLKENLPPFVAEEKYTKEVLEAIEPEIDKIKVRLSNILLECCISTCSIEGIKRFEKDYEIEINPEISLDERRRKVINKMLSKRSLTRFELENFIMRNINEGQYYISNMAEEYCFKVMITDAAYAGELYDALFHARPCHLVFQVSLVSWKPRCGTVRCNQNII